MFTVEMIEWATYTYIRSMSLENTRDHLNGQSSLQNTLKKQTDWPEIFLKKTPKTER
ncbi:MAG: hypothetical protein HYV41_01310 [Candidatus Magasanikbacteria bacterium]|nr:hypothetical protein [Candidatus Magasanikbacteria bacterium]